MRFEAKFATQHSPLFTAVLVFGVAGVCLFSARPSQAEIYKFVDENGLVTYTNMPRPGVKPKMVLPDSPRQNTPSAISNAAAKPSGKVATPYYFPKVDKELQRKRDDKRLQLLMDELRNEERNLASSRTELSQSGLRPGADRDKLTDSVRMHEKNIEMLNKELTHLR